jgi:hypothetical protein
MIMAILIYYILFIAIVLIVTGSIRSNRTTKANEKLERRMDKVVTLTGGLANDRIYERNTDTGKMRSRKPGDYNNNSPYEPINNGSKYYK